MTIVLDTIPEALREEVDAALIWFNGQHSGAYEVTGIIDPPTEPASEHGLRLVLCGEGQCLQESFRITPEAGGFAVSALTADAAPGGVAELDPPPGPRRRWVDEVRDRHAFVMLVFYRGFW